MATYTRVELRNAVMHDLSILDAGSAASAEDMVLVDARIQSRLEELADAGLIPFDLDGNAIPAAYLVPLSRVIGPSVAPAFGKLDQLQALAALEAEGMKSLRRLKVKPYYGAPAKANYF